MNQPKVIYDEDGRIVYSACMRNGEIFAENEEGITLKYDEKKKLRHYKYLNEGEKEIIDEMYPVHKWKFDPKIKKY